MTGPTDFAADLAAAKAHMRAKLRFRRKHFVANLDGMAALAAFRSLPAPLAELLTQNAPMVSSYAASGGEPEITPLLLSIGLQSLAMPFHALRDEHMVFRLWNAADPLETGPWRTPQPLDGGQTVVPDIICCPMVGFDRAGGRLGQGGGHYDRYFEKHPQALRIGIAWSIQEVDLIPAEPTDMRLDAILTEQEYIICGERLP
jgi:5-formyltetrahydrofolate cyclo-ligase